MIDINRMISENKLDELYKFLHKNENKEICIWGAGPSGEKVLSYIERYGGGVTVDCFIDNDLSKEGTVFCDIYVISPRMFEREKQYAVIVASGHHLEIIDKLSEYSITEYYDSMELLYPNTKTFRNFYKGKKYTDYFCPIPFENLLLYRNRANSCCSHYIGEVPIGNPQYDTIDEIWNSPFAREIRSSVLNGTFCFCDMDFCSYAIPKKNIKDPNHLDIIEKERTIIENGPKMLNISVDDSCNLSCKMCRTTKVDCYKDEDVVRLVSNIIEYKWENVEKIVLAGSGEVFYSPNYERILNGISDKNFPSLKTIVLYTNAVLFDENKWNKFSWLAEKYEIEVTVSVDAYTEKTYDKIRRGGSFNAVCKNLQMISKLRCSGIVKRFQLNYCVQNDNYLEMKDFVRWAEELKVDHLWFQILRGAVGLENIHERNHPNYRDFVEIVKDPIFCQEWIDIQQIENELSRRE